MRRRLVYDDYFEVGRRFDKCSLRTKLLPNRVAPSYESANVVGCSWEGKAVSVDLTRETIEMCPAFDAGAPINREYEARLYDYYGRPAYWEAPPPSIAAPPPQL